MLKMAVRLKRTAKARPIGLIKKIHLLPPKAVQCVFELDVRERAEGLARY